MFRYFARRRRRRRRSQKGEEDEHDDDNDDGDEAVQLLPITADKLYAKQAPTSTPPPPQQQHSFRKPFAVTSSDEKTPFVQRRVEKPHHLQQQQQHSHHRHTHEQQHYHTSHDSELYGLVQKLATKLQQSEARNKKLANNLSVVKVLQLQLDDARRLLRAVLWPYHGDYNSKDYMKAVEHVSKLRVELSRQRQTHEAFLANLETLNQIRKESSPEEMIALLDEQDQEQNEAKTVDETTTTTTTTTTQTHATISVLQEQNTSLQEQVVTLQQTIERLENERERHVKEIGTLLERSMQLQEELEATNKLANFTDREDIPDVSEQRSDLEQRDLDELMKQFKHESEHLFE